MQIQSAIEQEVIDATKFNGKRYKERQDYLAALVRAVDGMDEDDYDNLTDKAADWFTDAAKALNAKHTIPDFEDVPENAADEDDEETEQKRDDDEDEKNDSDEDDEDDEDEADEEEVKTAKKSKAKPKSGRKPVEDPGKRYPKITGEKDRYGIIMGTKTHDAVLLYEKGASSKDILGALNGRYYNILRKLAEEGHKVEKLPEGVFKLTHKDDLKGAKRAK